MLILMLKFSAGMAWANLMQAPPPLSEIVASADHVFLGTVEDVKAVDSTGRVIEDPPTLMAREMRIQLTVKTDAQWLHTPLKRLPPLVKVTYESGKYMQSYQSERQRYV
jgi:hypothetical protein